MKAFSAIRSHISSRFVSIHRIGLSFSEKRTFCGINSAESNPYKDVDDMEKKSVAKPGSPTHLSLGSEKKKLKAILPFCDTGIATAIPPHFVYLIELGMNLDQLRVVMKRYPKFANYSLEGKIKPVVELLLDLGMSRSQVPNILYKWPMLCGIDISKNSIPTMKFIESLGMDKKKREKMLCRFPPLLQYRRQKVEDNVDFLYEMGVSPNNICKILTICPRILGLSVDKNLRPTAEYFRSLGVDVTVLLNKCPHNFGLSIDTKLKPVTKFFLEKGYIIEEVGSMISRYGQLYTFSLSQTIIPKWEFFLTMDYSIIDLVKFPQYFGYSLEVRIKPRYERVKECKVWMPLNPMLAKSEHEFEMSLERKMRKMSSERI